LGFAIPADVVRDSVNRFKKIAQKQPDIKKQLATSDASVSNTERLFGMQLQNLSQELSSALGYTKGRGVLIAAVEPDSPADQAGIERGLVVYRVGQSEVNSVKQIENLLGSVQSGANVTFTVGVIRASGQSRQLATLTMTAR
jgi:serine protease Do